ncbi:glycoside hydrolase family 88 protein [Bacteroides sp.]|uniref:glycoside hydrolase family 88 protein n=1 Tax=Bacteroides sp. TaxID=29523 RepID=UPI0011DDFF3C|nr:glycoside hydrolase family 88 protein [Bacteroides sp.]
MRLKEQIAILALGAGFAGCTPQPATNLIEDNMEFAQQQLRFAFDEIDYAIVNESPESRAKREKNGWGELTNPRNSEPDGTLNLVPSKDWTSGFFPGELWFLYEYTQNNFWKKKAQQHTDILEKEKMNGSTHDMGFKVYCSFGNGYRLTQDEHYKEVLLQSARTLATRFKPAAGIIRSWDHSTAKWVCPVIIDNMMNLELLFWATKESKDSTFYRIAVDHARTTMKHHFRPDFSSYHVIDYDTITGQVLKKNTHQGFADESAWSRGQAWALYGYTMCYRETRLPEFLEQAQNIEKYLFTHPNMPEDLIPYWDFDAPGIPDEPRDVSAATVIASALYELSLYDPEKGERYRSNADKIIENLTKHYRATLKKDNGFLLLHSTGTKPTNTEVDVPIVYADYYFIEALMRKNKLEKTGKLF